MRTNLLAYLTTQLSTSTAVKCAQELPWDQNGQPLFIKNMKKLYVDQTYQEEATLYTVFNGSDIYEDVLKLNCYFAVDAKNPPSGLDAVISTILNAKTSTGVPTNAGVEVDYTIDKSEDVLIYTFEFRANTISYQ